MPQSYLKSFMINVMTAPIVSIMGLQNILVIDLTYFSFIYHQFIYLDGYGFSQPLSNIDFNEIIDRELLTKKMKIAARLNASTDEPFLGIRPSRGNNQMAYLL